MKLTKPESDDQVISNGKIGLLGDTEQEIDPNPAPPEMSPHFDANGNPMQLPAAGQEPDDKMEARYRGTDIKTLLVKASAQDLAELDALVKAAEEAPHLNGEATAVKRKLKELARKIL
jgi:hypothetical protein